MAYLVLMTEGHNGTRFTLDKSLLSIGRSPECDIYLDDPSVSHRHAVLNAQSEESKDKPSFWLKDTESTNGTFVNNQKVAAVKLQHNDNIVIGLSNFRFVDEDESGLERTQQIKKSWIPGVFYLKDKS